MRRDHDHAGVVLAELESPRRLLIFAPDPKGSDVRLHFEGAAPRLVPGRREVVVRHESVSVFCRQRDELIVWEHIRMNRLQAHRTVGRLALVYRTEGEGFAWVAPCPSCGELRGWAYGDAAIDGSPLICRCDWVPCRFCKRNLIKRPISDDIDPATGRIWHMPWFGAVAGCRECRAARQ